MANLKDVAKHANVSITTVSRVLNNDSTLNISNETRQNVINSAKQLGYKMKKSKQGLKFAIVNWYNHEQEIIDPYYYYIRAYVQRKCEEYKIETQILFSHDEISNLIDIDGIIAIGKFDKEDIKNMELYTNNLVFVDYSPDELKYDSVVNNFQEITNKLITMFKEDGYENISYIGGVERVKSGKAIEDPRYKYFIETTKKLNVYNSQYIYQGEFNAESGYNNMKKLLKAPHKLPMAIFCANDVIALGVSKAILEAGYNIPNDFSLFGFNDIAISQYMHPSLSTIHVHISDMAYEAVEVLLKRIKNPNSIFKKIVIPTKLIMRDSYIKRKEL